MQLRRAVPLSLAVLLAGTGCVSGGTGGAPQPAPSRTAETPAPPSGGITPPARAGEPTGALFGETGPAPTVRHSPGTDAGVGPDASGPTPPRRAAERAGKPSAPRRTSPHKPAPSHPRRHAAPPPARVPGQQDMDDLCSVAEAAEGTVPPSVMDLCVGRSAD
ncbi:hypothetical protein ABZY31_26585 [Streptomyces sp. NPDC006529]|uniref:hypothetical protein n=1 Tax=Streptomyces sp. NPDC006529 TaxID=3157177 RepID=UPI0033AD57FD